MATIRYYKWPVLDGVLIYKIDQDFAYYYDWESGGFAKSVTPRSILIEDPTCIALTEEEAFLELL